MKFCNHCITDGELRPIIEGLGHKERACPMCGKRQALVYDTDVNSDLTDYFEQLLEIYTPESMLPPNFPDEEKRLLVTELTDRWHIFNEDLNLTDVYRITRALCTEKYTSMPNLFDAPIGIAELNDDVFLRNHSLLRSNSWDDFVDSVKTQNRFHTNHIQLTILNRYCSFIRKVYKKGTIFYRARVSSSDDGFAVKDMGAPPADKATAGRANSAGIRCLYLASDPDTTFHEIRAGLFDYVTLGRFELTQDIVVVDLKAIDHISPFLESCDFLEHAINKEHLKRINREIGRALRRSDSGLDYVPTQYIADFIKSILHEGKPEYAGIEYNSTLNHRGQNLAIFYPELFVCTDIEVHHITELKYDSTKL